MRERKRDWPVIVYKFWARPIGDVPEEFWNLARGINNLWNSLLEIRAIARDRTAAEKDNEQKKANWQSFWVEARNHVRNSELNWEIKGEVFDRFVTASRRVAKEQLDLKPHHSLRRVMIPHRFTGGGIPVARIFNLAFPGKRLKIRPVPDHAYCDNRRASTRQRLTHGIFGLSDSAKIEFETILHRPIPNDAILKKSLWVGEFDRSLPQAHRWTWSLQLVCEISEKDYCRNPSVIDRPSCGLDLGWRVMSNGEYLRIGVIVDSLGRAVELRLPLFMGRKRDETKQGWISSLYDLIAFDSRIDLELEGAKTKLGDILVEKPAGLDKMRQNGLRKLLRETKDQRVINVLTEWEERNGNLCAIRASVRRRIRRRKSWLYRNLAAWIAATYGIIVWEGNFSLKRMSMRSESPAFRAAAKYREWAGLGELRTAIKNAARKYRSEIIQAETFNTTRRCFVCSAEHKGDKSELHLECPNGHRWDQDINAARNILFCQFSDGPEQVKRFRIMHGSEFTASIDIPALLTEIAVPCSVQPG